VSTSEGKCVLVEVGALISRCIYSYRIVMLLVPYMWASMTFLPLSLSSHFLELAASIRPFPSCLVPLFQSESWSIAFRMKIKLIFI